MKDKNKQTEQMMDEEYSRELGGCLTVAATVVIFAFICGVIYLFT